MVADIDSLKLLFGSLRCNVPTAETQIDTCKTSFVCKRINLQANQRSERTKTVLGDSPAKKPSSKSNKKTWVFHKWILGNSFQIQVLGSPVGSAY